MRPAFIGSVLVALLAAGEAAGQTDDPPAPEKGITASGAIGVRLGGAETQRVGGAPFLGADLDLGRLGQSAWTRLQLEIAFLRGTLREFVELEDQTYAGSVYDLTGSIAAVQLLRAPSRRVQPFASVAFSVHAMSSSFNSTILDRRYNTNNFGLQAGLGVRVRLGSSGHRALALEIRRTSVRDLNRATLSVGYYRLMRDLGAPLR